ncbi:MAG: threonine/serine dehydratase [Reyranella sp.]|uniref:threonine ammonia-lyase n=1 Tax=Reyranella sp. TaxID=1929291 RepID=UPI003D0C7419
MTDAPPLLALERIRDAQRVLSLSGLPRTPCLELHDGRARPGRLFVKAENLLPTGSFKIRGATYRLSALTPEERRCGVVAYSTGNHAQAVAKAARDCGASATIVMSPDVPASKVVATERWGARVVNAAPSSDARRALAERLAAEQGLMIVPPYDDLAIIAGQGTIGLELAEDLPIATPTSVYVPIGGGGLISGVAAALKQTRPEIRIVGVEPESENDAFRSFREGRLVALPAPSGSVADAIKVQRLGNLTFPLIRRFVDDIELVSEAEIARAVLLAAEDMKMIVEPGGAVGLAAALRAMKARDGRHVAVLGGGNMPVSRLDEMRALLR